MSFLQTLDAVDWNDNLSDTSSASSGIELSESPEPGAIRRKRPRGPYQSPREIDSSYHGEEADFMEGVLPQKHGKRKRHQRLQSGEQLRLPSPFHGKEDTNETNPPSPSSGAGVGSASEVDWESFLREDTVMLPPSNWEAEFLVHQARIMDQSDYRGLIYDDLSQQNEDTASGDLEDAPWYPFDPEGVVIPDVEDEARQESVANGLDGQKPICYGMIHKVAVKVLPQALELMKMLQSTQANSEILRKQDIFLFKVFREEHGPSFLLRPHQTADTEPHLADNIAVLNIEVATTLAEIEAFCTFEAYSSSAKWISIANGSTLIQKNTYILVDIILYGPRERLQEVGKILDAKKTFLQEPDYWEPSLDYSNPHILDLSVVRPESQTVVDQLRSSPLLLDVVPQNKLSVEPATTHAILKQKIAMAFKNTTRAQNLKRIAADIRICTALLPHQEEALYFIMQRESGPIPEKYCLWKSKYINNDILFVHAITGCEKSAEPIEMGGGLVCDEMGLGKTLTMLSVIIRTASEAKAFASNTYSCVHLATAQPPVHSRATLVVVPSPLLLGEWVQEIKLHSTGFLSTKIYHSHGREGNARALADYDIVLSTYHTISHESADEKSPLWQIKWFRVILDEAHIIRRMSTKLFMAMKKLSANFRWCLTGTPVQNSLEDLAALVSFIGASPLDDIQKFRKYVISPLMRQSESGVENLRQLLDSVCLRRTNQLLNLPEAISESRLLTFSAVEEQQYNYTRDKLIRTINQNGLQLNNKKGYLGVFQLQLQLRRLCNHGTFQKLSLGADEFDPEQAIAHLKKQKEATCEGCSVKITGIRGVEEHRSGNFTVCGHLLCMKCVPKMKLAVQKVDGRDGCYRCSLCLEVVFGNYIVGEEESSGPSKRGSKHLSAWQYFDKDGCSTKVSAVVADIEHYKTEGKSIVFSCWTRSLDLIGIFLKSRNIPFVRIDGSHSLGQRKRVLENYQKDPTVMILLMTTGTGAIGLNLTVANCVYLLEPQWNPMVESQAIARVLRLGQKRNVRVVRYIMKGTVEEIELQPQQIRKIEHAKAGWKEDECT